MLPVSYIIQSGRRWLAPMQSALAEGSGIAPKELRRQGRAKKDITAIDGTGGHHYTASGQNPLPSGATGPKPVPKFGTEKRT